MDEELDLSNYWCWHEDCPDHGKTCVGNIVLKERYGKDNRALLKCVTGGLKLLNSGGIKLSTCQSLGLKTRGHVDDRCGGIPHVARFVQQRSEHQRDRQTDRTQPCNGAKASEFSNSPDAQEEIQEAKQTGWSQGIHNR